LAEIKWIKIYTDMISNKKIKRIRKLPEGNNIILIWVFLIVEAGKCNKNGGLYLTDLIPFNIEDLAIEFDFEKDIIRLALSVLEKYEMIEIYEDVIYIKNWEKYQNIDGLEKIREQTRLRNIKYREKQKLLNDVTRDGNVTSHDETDIDKEIDIDKDIKIYSSIVDYLNLKCNTKYKTSSTKTKKLIDARINEKFTLDDFKKVIDIKAAEWLKTDMAKYLRPETLFGTKFESYLNQQQKGGESNGKYGNRIKFNVPKAKTEDNRKSLDEEIADLELI